MIRSSILPGIVGLALITGLGTATNPTSANPLSTLTAVSGPVTSAASGERSEAVSIALANHSAPLSTGSPSVPPADGMGGTGGGQLEGIIQFVQEVLALLCGTGSGGTGSGGTGSAATTSGAVAAAGVVAVPVEG